MSPRWNGLTSMVPCHIGPLYQGVRIPVRHLSTDRVFPVFVSSSVSHKPLPLPDPRARAQVAFISSARTRLPGRERSRSATTLSAQTSSEWYHPPDSPDSQEASSSHDQEDVQRDIEAFKRLGLTQVPGRGIPISVKGVRNRGDGMDAFELEGWTYPFGDRGIDAAAGRSRRREAMDDYRRLDEEVADKLGLSAVHGGDDPFASLYAFGTQSSQPVAESSRDPLSHGYPYWPKSSSYIPSVPSDMHETFLLRHPVPPLPFGNSIFPSRSRTRVEHELEFDSERIGGYWVKPPLVAETLRELTMELGSGFALSWKSLSGIMVKPAEVLELVGDGITMGSRRSDAESILLSNGQAEKHAAPSDMVAVDPQDVLAEIKDRLKSAGYARLGLSKAKEQLCRSDKAAQRLLRESISRLRSDQDFSTILRNIPIGVYRNILRSALAYARPEQGMNLLRDLSILDIGRTEIIIASLKELMKWHAHYGPPTAPRTEEAVLQAKEYKAGGPARAKLALEMRRLSMTLARKLDTTAFAGPTTGLAIGPPRLPLDMIRFLLRYTPNARGHRDDILTETIDSTQLARAARTIVESYSGSGSADITIGREADCGLVIRVLAALVARAEYSLAEGVEASLIKADWISRLPDTCHLAAPTRAVQSITDLITALTRKASYSSAVACAVIGQDYIDDQDVDVASGLWRNTISQLIGGIVASGNPENLAQLTRFLTKTGFIKPSAASSSAGLSHQMVQAIYTANGRIRIRSSANLAIATRSHGYPPPVGQPLLDLVDYFAKHKPSELPRLVGTVRKHPSSLLPTHVQAFIIGLARSSLPGQAKAFYEYVVNRSGHDYAQVTATLKGDPATMLALVQAFGKARVGGSRKASLPPRDRAFANEVIRNFVLNSPSVKDLIPDALTDLERAFIMVDAPKSAFQILEYVAASHRGPSRRDIVALLTAVAKKDPQAGLQLVELAMEKTAISEITDRRAILRAFKVDQAEVHSKACALLGC